MRRVRVLPCLEGCAARTRKKRGEGAQDRSTEGGGEKGREGGGSDRLMRVFINIDIISWDLFYPSLTLAGPLIMFLRGTQSEKQSGIGPVRSNASIAEER